MPLAKKKPKKETTEDRMKKSLSELETWSTFGLKYDDFSLEKISQHVNTLSEIFETEEGGKLFDKKTTDASRDACIKLLLKIDEQLKKAKAEGGDTSKLEVAEIYLKAYLMKIAKPFGEEHKPVGYGFSVNEKEKTVMFTAEHPKKGQERISIPKSVLGSWVKTLTDLFINKGTKADIKPFADELMEYLGVKKEYLISINPVGGSFLEKSMKLILAESIGNYVVSEALKNYLEHEKQIENIVLSPGFRLKQIKPKRTILTP